MYPFQNIGRGAAARKKKYADTQVDELRYSAAGGAGRRQVGEDMETHLNDANQKMERNRAKSAL